MGNQSVYHPFLPNRSCSLQSGSTISILYQAPDTWILVRLYFFVTWSLMKKLIFAHISSTFWARPLRERPQGTAFLFVASFQKFSSSKVFLLENEYPHPKQSSINICTLNAIIGHNRKGVKQESHAPHGISSSSSHPCDEKLDNIMAFVQDISTKLFGLATIMHSQHTHFDIKFTSFQTQLDQIQRKLEEDED